MEKYKLKVLTMLKNEKNRIGTQTSDG